MELKDQFEKYYNSIMEEDVARCIVYAWTLMVIADTKIEPVELEALKNFARTNNITSPFNKNNWLPETVGEALNVYSVEGMDAIFDVIKEVITKTDTDTKRFLLYSLIELACVDGDFAQQEVDVLNRMVEIMEVSKVDLLKIGMLYATYKQKK
ncbi:MAG: hypothetical protein GY757_02170 [bacterium]|nr:hypothetical protein [bacterium]